MCKWKQRDRERLKDEQRIMKGWNVEVEDMDV